MSSFLPLHRLRNSSLAGVQSRYRQIIYTSFFSLKTITVVIYAFPLRRSDTLMMFLKFCFRTCKYNSWLQPYGDTNTKEVSFCIPFRKSPPLLIIILKSTEFDNYLIIIRYQKRRCKDYVH